MKILFLAPQPFFRHRGTPIAIRAVIEELGSAGHKIDLLTLHEGEDVELPNCRIHRIAAPPGVRNLRPGFSFKKLVCDVFMLAHCLRLLRREKYDLIHAVEESVFIALIGRWISGTPYIYDMDSSLSDQLINRFKPLRVVRGFLQLLEGTAARRSVGILAVCRSLEDQALRWAPERIIGRVEDMTLLDPTERPPVEDLRRSLAIDGPGAMYVGNLEPYQGIDLMLNGFAQAVRQVPNAALIVIGGSEEDIHRYRQVADELSIGARVHFVGPRPISDLGAYLSQADVLISPRTQGENTPMKIYSYLDSGRPVLATNLPTHTQVLDDDIAVLVNPDPDSLAHGLVRLMRDGALRARIASAAKARVREEYSREAFSRKLSSFYLSVEDAIRND